MKKQYLTHFLFSLAATLLMINASAQNEYSLNEKNSKLKISGTSNLHDWEMDAKGMSGETRLTKEDASTINVSQVNFTCPVEDIKSDHQLMDNKTYDALKKKKYPNISFKIESPEKVELNNGTGPVKGQLTIAGKTKQVELPCSFNFEKNNMVDVTGKIQINMTDYGVDPPTAMLGALKTGEKVYVEYDLQFENTSGIATNKN